MADEPKYNTQQPYRHKFVDLGGLWSHHDKEGNEYLFGPYTHNTCIYIFKAKNRTNDKQPSHMMKIKHKSFQAGYTGGDTDTQDEVPF